VRTQLRDPGLVTDLSSGPKRPDRHNDRNPAVEMKLRQQREKQRADALLRRAKIVAGIGKG
jgi:hypothetical protein